MSDEEIARTWSRAEDKVRDGVDALVSAANDFSRLRDYVVRLERKLSEAEAAAECRRYDLNGAEHRHEQATLDHKFDCAEVRRLAAAALGLENAESESTELFAFRRALERLGEDW